MSIEAIIFDMDGLLIDSEPFWKQAELEVFVPLGVPLTASMCQHTMGFRIEEVVAYWYERYPWGELNVISVVEDILGRVSRLVSESGTAMPGVYETLTFFSEEPVKLGLASSSWMRLIEQVLERLELRSFFEVVHSAEFEKRGKPDPDIFLTAARLLEVSPEACLVFEDSLAGVQAARGAGMKCVCVPDPLVSKERVLEIADVVIPSLERFDRKLWNELNQ